jgi:acyl dehydratase
MLVQRYIGLPSMVWPYCKVLRSNKPLLSPPNASIPAVRVEAQHVSIKSAHLRRYRAIAGLIDNGYLPHAYLHVLAMPLHMRVFTHAYFPLKVLGLVHVRNTIRQYQSVVVNSTLHLSVEFNTLHQIDDGQEVELITRASIGEQLVWEEASIMLARRATPGRRPVIERLQRDDTQLVDEQTITVAANTGRHYAFVSGDFNPIHLFDCTARAFQFKQAVSHGMWSLARCIGLAQASFANGPIEIDAQFKLPIYLPSKFIFRSQRNTQDQRRMDLALMTTKGDRLHLAVQCRPLDL